MLIVLTIQSIFKNIATTIRRFPVPVGLSIFAFIVLVLEMHHVVDSKHVTKNYILVRLFLEALSGIPIFIAFDFFVQTKKAELSKRIGLFLLGFCILGLHYYSLTPGMFDTETIFVSRYLIFIACFHLLISIVTFYHTHEILSFWQYNCFLFIQFFKSIGFSISLIIGLGSAVWAVDNLFGMHFHNNYYIDLIAFIAIVFNTLFFLGNIPSNFKTFNQPVQFKKSIESFLHFVILPITGIYLVILYVYMFKILLENRIPNGWICIPILFFAMLGILAYVLIYPKREESKSNIFTFYSSYFFYTLLPLLTLYFIAIIQRILPYGITEDRYLILVLGLWLLSVTVYFIVSSKKNIQLIPISLFIALSMSAIGPWGMFQLSGQNQMMRLEKILRRNHLLMNNKLTAAPNQKISSEDAASIRSILLYFGKRGELNRIHKWLGETDQKVLENAIHNNELHVLNAIFISSDLKHEDSYYTTYTFIPDKKMFEETPMTLKGYDKIVHVSFFASGLIESDTNHVYAIVINDSMYAIQAKDTLFKVDFSHIKKQVLAYKFKLDSISNAKKPIDQSIQLIYEQYPTIEMPTDSIQIETSQAKVYLNELKLTLDHKMYTISQFDAYVLFKNKE
jgi:hypothetical protein